MAIRVDINDRLINRVAVGDTKAFDELYDKTKRVVFGVALSITKSPSESEDVSQDVYTKIFMHAKGYKNTGNPVGWIYTIARNEALSKIKRNKKIEEVDRMEDDIRFSTIDKNIDKLILNSALETLSEEEVQIVLMKNSGLRHREIATMMDKPLSTILSKYKRSLSKMREFLELEGGII